MSKVNPWGSGQITNYEKLFSEFGLERIPEEYAKKLKFRLFERGLVVAHRDFNKILARIEKEQQFINITGIATSGKLHFGHKMDIDLFVFFKQCGAKNYFGVADIDAYVSRPDSKIPNLETAKEFAIENLAHALALGLDPKDIFVQSTQGSRYFEFSHELSKKITENTYKAIYGSIDLGKISAVLLQIADILHPQLKEFEGPIPSVTGIGLEQDPHARITRDVARRLQYSLTLPSFIYFKHQGGLQKGTKMSSSEPHTAIFLSDKPEDAENKIKRKTFTGGRDTIEEQRQLGGQPNVCKVYEMYLMHYPNTKKVEDIYKTCRSGDLTCKDCKQHCAKFVKDFLVEHQKKFVKTEKVAKKIILG
jgi:tryptophanyl-tRNA synthetase